MDSDEQERILSYLADGQRIWYRRGQRRNLDLPIVPAIMTDLELFVSSYMPEQGYRAVAAVAERWKREGITSPGEVGGWIAAGASLSSPSVAGELHLQGVTSDLAALNAGRHGKRNLTNFTYYGLVAHGFCSAHEVRQMLVNKGQLAAGDPTIGVGSAKSGRVETWQGSER